MVNVTIQPLKMFTSCYRTHCIKKIEFHLVIHICQTIVNTTHSKKKKIYIVAQCTHTLYIVEREVLQNYTYP